MPSTSLISINPNTMGVIFDMAGRRKKTLKALFDGNSTTRINLDGIYDPLSQPWSSWLVLPNIYGNMKADHDDAFGTTGVGLTLDLYDVNRLFIATYYMEFGSGSINMSTHTTVRFIKFSAATYADMEAGIFAVRLYGDVTGSAPSIFPSEVQLPRVDPGVWSHGVCNLDDKLVQIDSGGNNLMLKTGRTYRIGYEGPRWDYYPDTYTGPLASSPLYLGRFGTDSMKNRIIDWAKTNNRRIQMYHVGGSIKGLNGTDAAASNSAYVTSVNGQKYIEPGADPTNPNSWAGLAERFYTLIALYGSNTSASLAGKTIIGGSATVGQNGIRVFELGNEWTKDWLGAEAFHSPAVMYAAASKVYPRAKAADPNCRLYLGALTFMDNTFFEALFFEHYRLNGKDVPFPCDGFNMNLYLSDQLDGQAGTTALNPEAWGLLTRLNALKAFFDVAFPNKALVLSENGVASFAGSSFNAVAIGAKPVEQVAADLMMRNEAICQMAKFLEAFYHYAGFPDGSGDFNSMSLAEQGNAPNYYVVPYPIAYARANQIDRQDGYNNYADTIINGGTTGPYVIKQDHQTNPLKKLFKIWHGTYNGSSANVNVPVGAGAVSATLYPMNYTSYVNTGTPATIASGNVTVLASEGMQWLEVTYSGTTPTAPSYTIKVRKGQKVRWKRG